LGWSLTGKRSKNRPENAPKITAHNLKIWKIYTNQRFEVINRDSWDIFEPKAVAFYCLAYFVSFWVKFLKGEKTIPPDDVRVRQQKFLLYSFYDRMSFL
jgi:hypothetical protein